MTYRLEVKNLSVSYGEYRAVKEISFKLKQGEIGCLLGPSGCGKTTLLRAIAGFEKPALGDIHIDGSLANEHPPEKRGLGVVFQDYALFPHLTVKDNIAFGLRQLNPQDKQRHIGEVLDLVGLPGSESRYPHQLSGGQQQRVALARAMAPKPRLLLIDEPFSNLDVELREHLAHELRRILKESDMTALLVTHDQQEAFVMADEIGVMASGCLQQWGDAQTIYQKPANRFVADFIGHGTFLSAEVCAEGLKTALGFLPLNDSDLIQGQSIDILVRPNQIRLEASSSGNACVHRKAFRGIDMLYVLKMNEGIEILSVTPTDSQYQIGEWLQASLDVHQPVILK